MKPIITIKAWNRPDYFKEVIDGLERCFNRIGYSIPTYISLDTAPQEITEEMVNHIKERPSVLQSCMVMTNKQTAGCAGNTFLLLDKAFKDGADFVIHLEDDTVPAGDFLEYMLWGYAQMENNPLYFAVCPFNRSAVAHTVPEGGIGDSYQKAWFECGGGFGIPKRSWDFIESKGGMFGAVGPTNNHDVVGLPWKETIMQTWKGSWAWPFNQFFRERSLTEHLCIFPCKSRTQNIGCENGVFNPSIEWHEENILTKDFIGFDKVPIDQVYTLHTDSIVLPSV
jgi:hypothetical protein